ncbi:hypothetical protein PV326_002495 [Microctonus aethiopoides]|nr:hypothetical protein PV326_002495 [Microctonus aethiopoides]
MTPYKIPPTMRNKNDGANNVKQGNGTQTYILVCNICGQSHDTHDCPFLQDLHYIKDTPQLSRARQSLPTNLELTPMADSTISVITKRDFQRGTTFGPFEASRNWAMNPLITFPIKIFKNNCSEISYLDYSDETTSNWMCFIQPASNAKEQNLICYQMKDDIFYTAMRTISAGEQLRVWYAPYYAIKMKMPLYNNDSISDETIYKNEKSTNIINTNINNSTFININESSELAERLSAERLGAKDGKENWTCRICSSEIKTIVAYAKHLMEHYKPLLGTYCNICNKKFHSMSLLAKHRVVKHTEINKNNEAIGIPTSGNQQQQNAQTILLNMNNTEEQTSDAMKDILEKFKAGNTMTESSLVMSGKDNQHTDLSLLDTNTLNVNDLLQNNGNLIENSSLKSILENQCLNININSMANSILSEKISEVEEVKFNVEELLDIAPDVENVNQRVDNLDCDICGKKFIKTDYLYRHLRKHTGEFICSVCLSVFARKENLMSHTCLNQKDHLDFECPYCQKHFAMKKYLKRHMSQHLSFNTCKWCRCIFTSQTELNEHKCQAPKHVCDQCGKRFVHRAHLLRHLKLHTEPKPKATKIKKKVIDEKPAICEKCGDIFKSPYSLKQHLRSHGERNYECDICQRRFHRIGVLKEHKQIHQSAQIPCNICGKKLKSKKALDVHVLLHGNKKFQCDKCDKSFFQRCNYLKHYKHIHSEKIIYKCTHCPTEFTSESVFNKHIETHTNSQKVPQFSCTLCTKSFISQYQLKRHMGTSHSGFIYRCPYCIMTAKHRHSMRRHFERQHKSFNEEWDKPGFVNQLMEKVNNNPTTNIEKPTIEFNKNVIADNQQLVLHSDNNNINETFTNTPQASLNNQDILLQVSNVDQTTIENNQLPLTEVPQISISDTDTQLAESVLNNTYIFGEDGGDIMFYVLDGAPVNF